VTDKIKSVLCFPIVYFLDRENESVCVNIGSEALFTAPPLLGEMRLQLKHEL